MLEAIKEKIGEKEFDVALKMIDTELCGRFDLSEERTQDLFNMLYSLKEECETGLLENICSIINKDETTRSFAGDSYVFRKKVSLEDLSKDKFSTEAFSQIKFERKNFLSSDYEIYINILYSRGITEESLLHSHLPEESLNVICELDAGENYQTELADGKPCYFVAGSEQNGEIKTDAIARAFNDIINFVYDNKIRKVGILISDPGTSGFVELRASYYQLVILLLLLEIKSYQTGPLKPIFSFLFPDGHTSRVFEKALVRLNKPDEDIHAISKNSDKSFWDFQKACLTSDPVYIKALKALYYIVDQVDVPILILGESGVGKSVLAGNIHKHSSRSAAGFEEQNCGGLSEDKLDQRLFGWKKGAFTGASKDTKGKIERAEGGTLFLDEIDRMSQAVRNALLTFIDTKKYDILGDVTTTTANIRLIFGSNKNLLELVRKSLFEEDFYYRICQRQITIPPLRYRIGDVDIIVENIRSEMNVKNNKYISFEPEALSYFKAYSWPGNVRELVTYIKQRYYDTLALGSTTITLRQCEEAPFGETAVSREDDYIELIEIIKKLLDNWDIKNGKFLEEVIKPVLAKVYLEDCFSNLKTTKKKVQAMDIIGIDGSKFDSSKLHDYYIKFPMVKKKLGF